jgi:hypothetical protein
MLMAKPGSSRSHDRGKRHSVTPAISSRYRASCGRLCPVHLGASPACQASYLAGTDWFRFPRNQSASPSAAIAGGRACPKGNHRCLNPPSPIRGYGDSRSASAARSAIRSRRSAPASRQQPGRWPRNTPIPRIRHPNRPGPAGPQTPASGRERPVADRGTGPPTWPPVGGIAPVGAATGGLCDWALGRAARRCRRTARRPTGGTGQDDRRRSTALLGNRPPRRLHAAHRRAGRHVWALAARAGTIEASSGSA